MAHQRIGRIDKSQGDTSAALNEFGLRLDLRPHDAVLRFEYGTALLEVGRFAEAETQAPRRAPSRTQEARRRISELTAPVPGR